MIGYIPDELIMAFADGELDAPLALRIREAIRSDPEVRRKYSVFLSTRPLAEAAFARILAEPVPERLKRSLALACCARAGQAS